MNTIDNVIKGLEAQLDQYIYDNELRMKLYKQTEEKILEIKTILSGLKELVK